MKFFKGALLGLLLSTSAFAVDPRSFMPVKVTGQDNATDADVTNVGGKNRLEVNAAQSGTWTTGRTWALLNTTDSVNAVQSGTWTTGRTWTLSSGTDSIAAVQSGTWTTGRTWTLASGTDSVAAVQSGTWTVQQGATPTAIANAWPFKLTDGTNVTAVKAASTAAVAADPSAVVALSPNSPLPTGTNNIGSITNVTGTVSLPTGAATSALQTTGNAILTTIDAGIPAALGQTTMSASMPVTIASDQTTTALKAGYTGTAIRLDDMNVANGGVARGTGITSTTVYTTLYSYTGQGTLFSFLVTFQGNLIGADVFDIRLVIDGTNVFTISTNDVGTNTLYNLTSDGDENTMGMSLNTNVFRFAAPRNFGITYSSSIQVQIKKDSSASSKNFLAGLVYLTKG